MRVHARTYMYIEDGISCADIERLKSEVKIVLCCSFCSYRGTTRLEFALQTRTRWKLLTL